MSLESSDSIARRFIADHIASVAQLEALLLLRTNPRQTWTSAELARELRVEPDWAAAQLADLCDRGLLELQAGEPASFSYKPRTRPLEEAVTAVAQAYLVHRIRVIELIYAKPPGGLRAFSDAFLLRKPGSDRRDHKEPSGG
jgi:hypothetical protein